MNIQKSIAIFLAEDDEDDILLFKEAITDLPMEVTLIVMRDGKKLMEELINNPDRVPDVLFLDLRMPIMDGFECLFEIKNNATIKHLPVIILSTFFNREIAKQVYASGAVYYLRKQGEFSELKLIIRKSIFLILEIEEDYLVEEKIVIAH